MTAVSAPEVALPSTPSPCALFPTESEDYYCLSCHVRCSGLALLVGPHTNHDYLPLRDALLYVPAALLRETREVAQEVEEGFAKPWRVHDQQREDAVRHLVGLRRDKLAAVARLMAEVQGVDVELLRVTEAKALDVANWRYQHRGLQTRMERLLRGARTLTASYATPPPPSSASASAAAATATPAWPHTRHAAQRELAQVRETLCSQLARMAAEEQACTARLQAWQQLLKDLPCATAAQRYTGPCGADGDVGVGGADTRDMEPPLNRSSSVPTRTAAAAAAGMNFTPVQEPPPPPPPQPQQQQSYTQASPTYPAGPAAAVASTSAIPLHPSDAEVVLLQHALRNVHDTLRQRLLRAAAASLSTSATSSSSRSPLSSQRTGSAADATGVTVTSLPPLPEATPLRRASAYESPLEADWGRAGVGMVPPCMAQGEHVPRAPHSQQQQQQQQRWTEPPTDAGDDDEQQQQQQQWRSWQLREKEVKDLLNEMLGSGAPPTSSSASFSNPALGHGGAAASAASSSIPVHPRSLGSR